MVASVCALSGCVFLPPFYVEGENYQVSPALLAGRWRHPDGAESTWITPFYHRTSESDGTLRHMHSFPYFAVGERSGVIPVYFRGPGYSVAPPLLSGRWTHGDGATSTWLTPLYHKTVDADGTLRDMHYLNYFAGPNYKVLFPFVYRVGEHMGVPPFYFRGPTYKVCPLLLSGRWTHGDGATSTWLTPLYHKTVNADGSLRHMHVLVFPKWGKRRGERMKARRRAAEERRRLDEDPRRADLEEAEALREVVDEAERKATEEWRRREEEARKRRESVPALIEALKSGDRGERRWAAALLREKGAEARDAVPALIEALGDARFDMRRSAADALAGIGPAAVPALVRALEEAESKVRWSAAYALGEIGPAAKEAVPALTKASEDADGNVAACAAEALAKVRGKVRGRE